MKHHGILDVSGQNPVASSDWSLLCLSLRAEDQAGVQGQKRKRDVDDEGEDDDEDDDDD